jgi:hypothetical protein
MGLPSPSVAFWEGVREPVEGFDEGVECVDEGLEEERPERGMYR